MILTVVRCEACDNQFHFSSQQRPYDRNVPSNWLTLFQGKPEGSEGWHFCSRQCLRRWLMERSTLDDLPPAHLAHVGEQGPKEQAYFASQTELKAADPSGKSKAWTAERVNI